MYLTDSINTMFLPGVLIVIMVLRLTIPIQNMHHLTTTILHMDLPKLQSRTTENTTSITLVVQTREITTLKCLHIEQSHHPRTWLIIELILLLRHLLDRHHVPTVRHNDIPRPCLLFTAGHAQVQNPIITILIPTLHLSTTTPVYPP
jgi:hypothetical protein